MIPKNKKNLKPLVSLVLHNIRSAYNVGSIFRTADGAGVSKIYLCGITSNPNDEPKISKTALGAEKTVTWEYCKQTWRLLDKLKKEGVEVVALEQDKKAVDYRKFKPKRPVALVLGNEVGGLSPTILRAADAIMEIPMRGKKESLNVSVAAGVALYEITNQNS